MDIYYIKWLKVVALSTIFTVLLSSCSSSSDSLALNDSPSFGIDRETYATSELGEAQIVVSNGAEYDVLVKDESTRANLSDISINVEEFDSGFLIWTQDPQNRYFSEFAFLPYEDVGGLQARAPRVTLLFGLVAIFGIVNFAHEFATDPPGIEKFHRDRGVVEECLVGDMNDALSAIGLIAPLSTFHGMLSVFGAPAKLRGVTAIHQGFTTANLAKENYSILANHIGTQTGILSTDHQVFCWKTKDGRLLPPLTVEVTREEPDFFVSNVIAGEDNFIVDYSGFATGVDYDIKVFWEGEHTPPVTVYVSSTQTCSFNTNDEQCYAIVTLTEKYNPYVIKDIECQNYNFSPPKVYKKYYFLKDANGKVASPFYNEHSCDGIYNVINY